MYIRVVRFTDVSAGRVEQLVARIKEADAPPPGVRTTRLKILFDEAQSTAIATQEFATAQDMQEGARVLAAMDPSETPGTRVSVDECEVKVDLQA